jgi:transcriptional regulator of arginine metabolism
MKYNRHARILDLIEKYAVETQDELAEKLRDTGIEVTQATVSRDIKELRLIKVLTPGGTYRYAPFSKNESPLPGRLLAILSGAYVSSDYANNIAVIKTLPGMAQAAASAVDSLSWNEVVGTIAGDDTIMIVCRAEKIAEGIVEKFDNMIKQKQ